MRLPVRQRLTLWRRSAEAQLGGRGLAGPLFGRAWVHPGHFARLGATRDGLNINGPSLLAVPDWAPRRPHPTARYYLYFAHHLGKYLRMAWAPRLEGPWTLYNVGADRDPAARGRGVFDLAGRSEASFELQDGLRIGSPRPWGLHVASPDVHVDDEARRFVLYAHLPVLGGDHTQMTFGFTSEDGLTFEPAAGGFYACGVSYFRVFEVRGHRYAVSPGGWLHRATASGWCLEAPWVRGPRVVPIPDRAQYFEDGSLREGSVARHLAVEARGDDVTLYYTRVGDAPEAVLAADLDTQGDWQGWRAGPPRLVHRPVAPWEGAGHALRPSSGGMAAGGVNELRDPYLFTDPSGSRLLVYCVQGERAIAARTLGAPAR